MLRKLIFLGFAFLALAADVRAAEGTVKILLIGGDRDQAAEAHEFTPGCEILAKCLRQTKGVEAVVSHGWPKDAGMLKDVKAIVVFAPKGGNMLFDGPQKRQASEMLKNGVGLVAIHTGTAADQGEVAEAWLNALGGWFHSESKQAVQNAKFRQFDSEHPICRGWDEFVLRDEYLTNLRFLREANPVLKAQIDGKEEVIAWAYDRPESKNGRSFGLVPGHFHAGFAEEPFRRCLVNAILWSAHVEVPKGGAPCKVGAKDLELPAEKK
jgi:hypothetical protein